MTEYTANSVMVASIGLTFASYDAKNNPYQLLAKAINQPFYVNGNGNVAPDYLSKANPLSETQEIVIGGSPTPPAAIKYSYDYNSKGYPTKITVEVNGSSGLVTTFEYKDCN